MDRGAQPLPCWICSRDSLAAGRAANNDNEDTSAVSVQAEHPTVGPISEEFPADAILAPLAQAAIAPKISAPIAPEFVQRGAHVHKGQLLLTLEDRDLAGHALDFEGASPRRRPPTPTATHATIPEDVQKAELDLAQTKANLEVANRTAKSASDFSSRAPSPAATPTRPSPPPVQAQAAYDTAAKHLPSVQKTTRKTEQQAAQGQLTSAQGQTR